MKKPPKNLYLNRFLICIYCVHLFLFFTISFQKLISFPKIQIVVTHTHISINQIKQNHKKKITKKAKKKKTNEQREKRSEENRREEFTIKKNKNEKDNKT